MAETMRMLAYVQWMMVGLRPAHSLMPRLERIEAYLIRRTYRD